MRNYLTVAITASALCLTCGCDFGFERSVVSDQTWDVGDCKVREKIVRVDAIPDAEFERTYWLIKNGRELLVGRYNNESSMGVVKEPYAVEDCIVIPSSCYIYLVESDNRISVFVPFKADQWWSFAEPRGINGHYDYHVDTVRKTAGTWRLSYALESGLNGGRPPVIHFVTKDNWQSFQVETQEHEQDK